ncbi:hypothetical protein [Trichocoleus sp. FACHB-90]|nr:hypothetical protein [Trichocoleus sp. FACHB-90]
MMRKIMGINRTRSELSLWAIALGISIFPRKRSLPYHCSATPQVEHTGSC